MAGCLWFRSSSNYLYASRCSNKSVFLAPTEPFLNTRLKVSICIVTSYTTWRRSRLFSIVHILQLHTCPKLLGTLFPRPFPTNLRDHPHCILSYLFLLWNKHFYNVHSKAVWPQITRPVRSEDSRRDSYRNLIMKASARFGVPHSCPRPLHHEVASVKVQNGNVKKAMNLCHQSRPLACSSNCNSISFSKCSLISSTNKTDRLMKGVQKDTWALVSLTGSLGNVVK